MDREICPKPQRLAPSQIPPEVRVALAVAISLAFLVGAQVVHSKAVLAYSCNDGNLKVQHCYGYYDWYGNTNGSLTAISGVHLTCSSSCSNQHGFVDNEMWLLDTHDEPDAEFWVETGYESYPPGPSNNDEYFWADDRPPNGSYTFHAFGQVPAGDYGYLTGFQIVKESTQTYDVQVQSETDFFDAASTNSIVSPNDIDIGEELAGNGGANAPAAWFYYNQWVDSNNHLHYQGYGSDTTPYPLTSDNPPYASWLVHPQNSSTGGVFQTSCC